MKNFIFSLVILFAGACASEPNPYIGGIGSFSASDPATDPGTDAGTDPATDAGTEPDPGTDLGTDAGTDPDPGTDAGTEPDIGTDPVDADGDGVVAGVDCDDTRRGVYPGATEICNDLDDDCNGQIDDYAVDAEVYYLDNDGDGHGFASRSRETCTQPSGYVQSEDDCDDTRRSTYPGAAEVCGDGVDQDCTGEDLPCAVPDDGRVELCLDTAEFVADGVTQLRLFTLLANRSGVVFDDSHWYQWDRPTFLVWAVIAGGEDPCVDLAQTDDGQIGLNGFALKGGVWRHMVENDLSLVGAAYVRGGHQTFAVRAFPYQNGTDYDILNVAYVGK